MISKVQFSNPFYRFISWALTLKFSKVNVTRPHWCLVNIGSDNGLVLSAITWSNVDPNLRCHMASLGHNELMHSLYWLVSHNKTQVRPISPGIKLEHVARYLNSHYVYNISMGQCKKDVTPLLMHWSYTFLELTNRYMMQFNRKSLNRNWQFLNIYLIFLTPLNTECILDYY